MAGCGALARNFAHWHSRHQLPSSTNYRAQVEEDSEQPDDEKHVAIQRFGIHHQVVRYQVVPALQAAQVFAFGFD